MEVTEERDHELEDKTKKFSRLINKEKNEKKNFSEPQGYEC